MEPEDQEEHSSEEDPEEAPYDRIMTGWDPIHSIVMKK
ncbi:hypothetical protein K3495_g8172 [Podosphaera aphanis]|nr:hypothetical protein K3495_g8172 [Podosphaera aphanis]